MENVSFGLAVVPGGKISSRPICPTKNQRLSARGRAACGLRSVEHWYKTALTGGWCPESRSGARSANPVCAGMRYASQCDRPPRSKMPVSQLPCRAFGVAHAGNLTALYSFARPRDPEALRSFPFWVMGLVRVSFIQGDNQGCSVANLDGGDESPLVDVPRRVIRMSHFRFLKPLSIVSCTRPRAGVRCCDDFGV